MARFGGGGSGGGTFIESDPVAAARLDALGLTFSTDVERDAATAALQATDANLLALLGGKQDAATAATDDEVTALLATVLRRGEAYGTGAWTPGRWYFDSGSAVSTPPSNNVTIISPLRLVRAQPIDALAIIVVTAGEAGSLLDVALINDTGQGFPGQVAQRWDAIAGDVAGGKQLDLPAPFVPQRSGHWVAVRYYNAPTTRPALRSSPAPQLGLSAPSLATYVSNLTQSGANGMTVSFGAGQPIPDDMSVVAAALNAGTNINGIRVGVRAA